MIYVGNKGTKFRVIVMEDDSVVDVSLAGSWTLIFKPPGGPNVEVDAELETDGVDGKIFFIIGNDWVWKAGTWTIQALIGLPTGQQYTTMGSFVVKDPL